jgi:hypothetical protein
MERGKEITFGGSCSDQQYHPKALKLNTSTPSMVEQNKKFQSIT